MRLLDELRRRWWVALIVLAAAALLFGRSLATFWTDLLWYRSVGYAQVFTTVLGTRVGLGVAAGAAVAALVGGNLLLARRLAPAYRIPSPAEEAVERYREVFEAYARPLMLTAALLIGALSGLSVSSQWQRWLLFANGGEFGRTDPRFDLDLSFFVFRLPFYEFLNSWLFTTLAMVIVLTALAHYAVGGVRPQSPGQKVTPQANVHLSVLLALLVAVRAWGFWLDRYLLSYSERGVVTGLSYTDANALLPALQLLTVIAAVCVVLFLLNLRVRSFLLPSAGVGILLVAALVLSGIYPAAIQRIRVQPNELNLERPFIADNLELTRYGFGIQLGETVEFEQFAAEGQLTAEQVAANADTLASIRLWDPAVLSPVYTQLQGLRRYFQFPDVDVDRYEVEGSVEQVSLAVRELAPDNLPVSSWQSRHLAYTHGYGVVANDVSDTVGEGAPRFLAGDIPSTGEGELEVTRPQVYFGEQGPEYSIVGTGTQELDFVDEAEGAEQAFRYDGEDGVGVGSPLRRLAFAARYGEPNILLSGLIQPESRVLYRRDVAERVQAVAPFLRLDSDPYPAVVDGRITWIADAYTASDMVPYSTRVDLAPLTLSEQTVLRPQADGRGGFTVAQVSEQVPGLQGTANYLRNSVKAVVDAYDGTIRLYRVDDDDPVIEAWDRAFPGVLTSGDEVPDALRAHFRYPEDLFRVQSAIFQRYHVDDPDLYYQGSDAWGIPRDPTQSSDEAADAPRLRPSYLQLRLPGEADEEFVLAQPFNPQNRPNLIALLMARSDPEVYGQLRAYLLPASENIEGVEQAQARIRSDEEVSSNVTLLSQAGSEVIFGNLLTVPIADSLLYAQPLFVQAEDTSIPALRFVILVFDGRVVLESTLAGSLDALFGEDAGLAAGDPSAAPSDAPAAELDGEVEQLIGQALAAFAAADEALAAGDLGDYQEATQRARDLLAQVQALTGIEVGVAQTEETATSAATPSG